MKLKSETKGEGETTQAHDDNDDISPLHNPTHEMAQNMDSKPKKSDDKWWNRDNRILLEKINTKNPTISLFSWCKDTDFYLSLCHFFLLTEGIWVR